MSAVLVDTDDLVEAEAVVSANYSKIRLQTQPGPISFRVCRSDVGASYVDEADFSCNLDFAFDPFDSIIIMRIGTGGFRDGLRRDQQREFVAGQVVALGIGTGMPSGGLLQAGHLDQLVIDKRLLGRVTEGTPGSPDTVRLIAPAPVSAAANATVANLVQHIQRSASAELNPFSHPLVAAAANDYIATTLLTTFPSTAVLEPTIEDRHDSTPALLRRAMAFIDDNAHRDISLSEIAAEVFVSPRALQYMFRKHLDRTPTEYLRRTRLAYAHRDLIDSDPTTRTVSLIARKWGFSNTSRFAVAYRLAYGRSPLNTLYS